MLAPRRVKTRETFQNVCARRFGSTVRVLVEERRKLRRTDPIALALGTTDVTVGRSMGEAPGVDGGIFFAAAAQPGTFLDVRLDGAGAFDFYGANRIGDDLFANCLIALKASTASPCNRMSTLTSAASCSPASS